MRSRHAVARFAVGVVVAMVAAGTTLSTPAWADAHGDAVKAFTEGRKLRESDPERAAHAFERSIALEPSIGAYYNLGEVNELLNRPREAVAAFRLANLLAIQKGDPRSKDAQDASGKILDTHNYVVVIVSDEVKAAPGLEIEVDGVPVPEAHFNGEVFRPVATHEVVVRALHRKELRLTGVPNKQPVTILLGESSVPVVTPPPTDAAAQLSTGGWGWQKWTGAGMTVVGVAGVAYTLIDLLGYTSKQSSLDSDRQRFNAECRGTSDGAHYLRCDVPGDLGPANTNIDDYNHNEQRAKDATPLWIGLGTAGVLLIGGGIYLFATAPSASSKPEPPSAALRVHVIPNVGVRDNGLTLVGTF